ncbi:MAG: CAP domain-containing protein [Steroidobacteraceae bacterium]
MKRWYAGAPWSLATLLAALLAAPAARADSLSVVQMLRIGGCGGIIPAARPLEHQIELDRAAEKWADGHSLAAAAELAGYVAQSTRGLHVSGSDEALIQQLRRSQCRTVADRELRAAGSYRRGNETWLVLASSPSGAGASSSLGTHVAPAAPTPSYRPSSAAPQVSLTASASPALASRALKLVNEARARGGRCGSQAFGPAPPLTLSGTLDSVALGHATDMAVHGYFEHQDLSGQSPADRVRAVGYREKLVGENIAYGPITVEEAVQGWLHSPDHCENIMDPRFAEMGIGFASGQASRRGLFWVQLFAEPRA